MKHTLIYIGLMILLSACGQKSELIKSSWLVLDGAYMGQRIEFYSTDLIKFTDKHGNEIKRLKFSKDGTIILPGINSPNISAKWTIEDGQVSFSVDTIKYSIYNGIDTDLSFLDAGDSVPSHQESNDEPKNINPLTSNEFKRAMEIYRQSFKYDISHDTLMLIGQKGKIRLMRDRTIDDLFRNL